jgi:hypothetical protein
MKPRQPTVEITKEMHLEQHDKAPKVEHLVFGDNKHILIKTLFPHKNGTALSYILVEPPSERTQQEVEDDAVKLFGEMDPEDIKGLRKTFDRENMPYVFKGIEGVKKWFNQSYLNSSYYSNEDREKIERFLEL